MRNEPSLNHRAKSLTWLGLMVVMLPFGTSAAEAAVSLAGVHDYSSDITLLDTSLPLGERGWNVELVAAVDHCNGDLSYVRNPAQTAKNHGLVNIIRTDYLTGPQVAVPTNSGSYATWGNNFIQCVNALSDLSNTFIVGNEPNLDGGITAQQYIDAFNYLWGRKAEMPAGTLLLAAYNSPFTDPGWMATMSNGLNGTDGWAIHTGGIRNNQYGYCNDPRLDCDIPEFGWWFDAAFRYYRDIISNIVRHQTKPVYITEFNTYEGGSAPPPQQNYEDGWIQKAFEEVRSYNATRGANQPEVRALCWFTDRQRSGFEQWGLVNIPVARQDMREELQNPANHGGGTNPGNSANVLEGSSTIYDFLMHGEIRNFKIWMQNDGTTTWPASTLHRMAATPGVNDVVFTYFPQCGGYSVAPDNARVYLCSAVSPGGSYEFKVNGRAPTSGTSADFSVRMVEDGVEFFGETGTWNVTVGQNYCGTACTQCILFERPDILPFYGASGWNTACWNRDNIVNNWCSGLDPTACNSLKANECSSYCNTCRCSGGRHVDGTYIDTNSTFCNYKVCGMDNQQYKCTSSGWLGLGKSCQ